MFHPESCTSPVLTGFAQGLTKQQQCIALASRTLNFECSAQTAAHVRLDRCRSIGAYAAWRHADVHEEHDSKYNPPSSARRCSHCLFVSLSQISIAVCLLFLADSLWRAVARCPGAYLSLTVALSYLFCICVCLSSGRPTDRLEWSVCVCRYVVERIRQLAFTEKAFWFGRHTWEVRS